MNTDLARLERIPVNAPAAQSSPLGSLTLEGGNAAPTHPKDDPFRSAHARIIVAAGHVPGGAGLHRASVNNPECSGGWEPADHLAGRVEDVDRRVVVYVHL
ncbi:hypothetical protein GCM10009828_075800 [Actinoplanes couchii]|uniref:Uncharacterized protein n=1 Tax=Actinoplanes couchii TaxID=403638 RepID=A0ABQ3WZK0_9ACTN|nr:hypothetical protein Aco03nite_001150 [Actinoplanes couchii]